MASVDKHNYNFDIPAGLVAAGWLTFFPIGIVLSVLRARSEKYKKNRFPDAPSKKTHGKKSPKPVSAEARGVIGMKIGGIAFLAAAVCFVLGTIIFMSEAFSLSGLVSFIAASAASAAAGIALLIGSKKAREEGIRFARIRSVIGKNDSYNLVKLASVSGTSIRQTRRDVQKLIDRGEFGKTAYIDLGTDNFMRTPDAKPDTAVYDYKKSYGNIFSKKKTDSSEEDLGMKTDNDDFRSIIREIRRLNDEIKDEAVSERIFKIEEYTKTIFDYVSEHPEAMPRIRSFMNYYLPTTLKLLESYSRIEKVGVAGENMKKSKENIESTLDTLEVAFRMQIDDLFRAESIDISSDISVLETMISKDGLTEKKDFDLGGEAAQE